ncbi:MFS family permease [Phenylobacterium haematophilum]|uniref:MFS family permease n=1 Tax=Phenylobacterium haematophilum TaxID=98513 RepID=A0A840A3N3_9CAUL|nr:MFS transporter [Phenylobacterium haematophilum]MBB3892022.1 MFS family permease [Phenylobacterium haematophilum]
MAATDAGAAAPPRQPLFSESYKQSVLWLLVLAYTFNFIDRTIISTIGQAIKVDLKLTDTQLGLLGGLAFALLYTTLGIPIARIAERHSRVNIITIAIVIWSGFTALCGLATSFFQLLLFRVGVGVGEAGLSPPAHSLISDYFEPKKRASALSIYSFGIPLGTMFGAVAGGWIAQNLDWRMAFMLVGLPGVIVAILLKVFVKEPPRGYSDRLVAQQAADAPALEGDETAPAVHAKPPSILAVAKRIFGKWGFFHMVAGITLASFAGYGTGQYSAPYFIRMFGLDLATVGLIFGVIGGVAAGIGTLLGGFLTDWAAKKSGRWYALVPAIGLLIACPLYILVYTRDDWKLAAGLLLIPGIFHYTYLGPTFGVIQNAVSLRMRATATALLFFVLNLIALGFGPPFCGWVIDMLSQAHFAAKDLGPFFDLCPGGVGKEGAGAMIDAACKAAVAQGTRDGIVWNLLIYGWAGLHYLLAAITLPKDMADALAKTEAEAAAGV